MNHAKQKRKQKQELSEVLQLPAGVSIKPLYEQCPHCGADLTEFPKHHHPPDYPGGLQDIAQRNTAFGKRLVEEFRKLKERSEK